MKFLYSHVVLFFLVLFSIPGCTQKPPQLSILAPDAVILAFGDSLTYGTGTADPADSYPSVLQRLVGRKVINAGIPGELSSQGVTRLATSLEKHSPQLLILCHGGNDLLQKRSKHQLKKNLVNMIHIAQTHNVSVILVAVPEPKIAFMSNATLYEEIAKKEQIPIESKILLQVLKNNQLKADTVHPNAQGYQLIAEALNKLMTESGTI
ncbi:MAG: GDSL-type esterase/lipase family protein [Thiohalomonadales bacterium]